MPDYLTRLRLGKQGELFAFGELLKRGVVPYAPLVDIEGVDCVVRRPGGEYLEIQVKTVSTEKDPIWFQSKNVPDRDDSYFVLISVPRGWATWVLPARVFREHSTVSKGTYDLNLASAGREAKLNEYLDAWHLIVEAAELPKG